MPSRAELSSIEDFVAESGVGVFDQIPDADGVIWDRFDVLQHRTYVLINDDGSWSRTSYGNIEEDVVALIAQ